MRLSDLARSLFSSTPQSSKIAAAWLLLRLLSHSLSKPQSLSMRRASVETIEKLVQSKADQARERRLSLTIMNCIWARNTEQETTHPVHGEVIGKYFMYLLKIYIIAHLEICSTVKSKGSAAEFSEETSLVPRIFKVTSMCTCNCTVRST